MALTVVIGYDIERDSVRARVAALIQVWGVRVQKSLYLCVLDKDKLEELVGRLAGLVDQEEDSLYVFRQCADCFGQMGQIGQAHPPEPVTHITLF